MKKIVMGVLMGLLLIAVSQVSYAEQCGCGGRPGKGGMEEGMPMMHRGGEFMKNHPEAMRLLWRNLMAVGLDEKQKDAIKAIQSSVMKDTIKKRADIEVSGIELRELLRKDPVDMGAVEAKLKKIEAMRTDMHLTHIKAMMEIKAILTSDQRNKFKEGFEGGFMMEGRRHGGNRTSPFCVQKDDAQEKTEGK
jgi:Spy/CpxP family protein refolding chaperone